MPDLKQAREERFKNKQVNGVLTGRLKDTPKHLQQVFVKRRETMYLVDVFKEAVHAARVFRYENQTFDIDVDRVIELAKEAMQIVREGLPYQPCDCLAFWHCEKCGGRRWLSLKQVNSLSPTSGDDSTNSASPPMPNPPENTSPEETSLSEARSTPSLPEE